MPNRELDQFEIEDFCRDYGINIFISRLRIVYLISNLIFFFKEIDGYMEISVKKNIMVKETIE
jgi:hypothetical protein